MQITGNTLIEMGYQPGKWFKEALAYANEHQLAGSDLQRSRAALPAELKGMPVHSFPWTDPPKLARQQAPQRSTKIVLSRQAAAIGGEQGQEGSVGHESGHRRAVAPKDGPS